MPVEMGLWRLEGAEAKSILSSPLDTERRLEDILTKDLDILGLGPLLLIGRQVTTAFGGFIDLLAMSSQGDIYVIELKKDRTPREVVGQTLDYASWVRHLGYEDVSAIYAAHWPNGDFASAQAEVFGETPSEVNSSHHLVVVASGLDASTERIIDYLNDSQVPVNAVFFRYFRDGSSEYLARSWLVDPEESESRTTRKKPPWNGRDFYVSFGEGAHGARDWDDARRFGFVSGGGKPVYSRSLFALKPGHRVFAYIPQTGYVGVGTVAEPAQPAEEFEVETASGRVSILQAPGLKAPNMDHDRGNAENCEYVVRVDWRRAVSRDAAFREPGLFANQNTAARLRDTHTVARVTAHFRLGDTEDPVAD